MKKDFLIFMAVEIFMAFRNSKEANKNLIIKLADGIQSYKFQTMVCILYTGIFTSGRYTAVS